MLRLLNLELQKPDEADRLYLNLYGNTMSRGEINLQAAQKLNDKWSTMTMLHVSDQSNYQWSKPYSSDDL